MAETNTTVQAGEATLPVVDGFRQRGMEMTRLEFFSGGYLEMIQRSD